MAIENEDAGNFVEKVKAIVKDGGLDLSSDEDLSIGIMNLISIEEHLFFTANKTNKDTYYALLNEVREMRKMLLKEIIKDYEGEVWCISKHLLAASMRLMEVGTKALTKDETDKAKGLFKQSYRLFIMFWEINLRLDGPPKAESKSIGSAPLFPPSDRDEITLYVSLECEHCKKLETFLDNNKLYAIFTIIKKEISQNRENRAEMENLSKKCTDSQRELSLPFAISKGVCYRGDEVIKMFKDRIWETLKEKGKTINTLLKEANLPSHIQKHQEHYKQILETALNCCKE